MAFHILPAIAWDIVFFFHEVCMSGLFFCFFSSVFSLRRSCTGKICNLEHLIFCLILSGHLCNIWSIVALECSENWNKIFRQKQFLFFIFFLRCHLSLGNSGLYCTRPPHTGAVFQGRNGGVFTTHFISEMFALIIPNQ